MYSSTNDAPSPYEQRTVRSRSRIALGIGLQALSLFTGAAFCAHFGYSDVDRITIQSIPTLGIGEAAYQVKNRLGFLGALIGYFLMDRGLGITAFLLLPALYLSGHFLVYHTYLNRASLQSTYLWTFWSLLWLNAAIGYVAFTHPQLQWLSKCTGAFANQLGGLLDCLLGWGTWLWLIATLLMLALYYFYRNAPLPRTTKTYTQVTLLLPDSSKTAAKKRVTSPTSESVIQPMPMEKPKVVGPRHSLKSKTTYPMPKPSALYDPTLALSTYQYPKLDLLNTQPRTHIKVDPTELTQNKLKIQETLNNFKIGIASIKATTGPTVTLYEIVPEAGVKIAKIKNLEDDIALSLAALGIRIIAPMPGKGTIGIEVPNKHREIVTLTSIFSTAQFKQNEMELPIVLGQTIANETLIADLSCMPHLLIAGATGQGKSVGINTVLASLLYKKHPAQLKLVLVDPKKVELSLYNKLERHFLAKLAQEEEPIITETKKVVHTLNSLCLEMDQRYELLKGAGVRNITEYNARFVQRKLNPKKGHRFLPYIVLVIDEFADMMVTAGREVEAPIARLAQLARAIGIHLVLATQRPSVNVITGIIKANFPVRVSYKVTSRVDSRTILDTGGAEQLVGKGDMLLSMGAEITRLQGPFLDTQEVAQICAYIGDQQGYSTSYALPDCEEAQEAGPNASTKERDILFEEAAQLVVAHQQGSTSLIQRKLKLGYNRAGRLIDQLEAAGIVGPFEGSKARTVLIPDAYSLEQTLQTI